MSTAPLDVQYRALEDAGCYDAAEILRCNEEAPLLTTIAVYSVFETVTAFKPRMAREAHERRRALLAIREIARLVEVVL